MVLEYVVSSSHDKPSSPCPPKSPLASHQSSHRNPPRHTPCFQIEKIQSRKPSIPPQRFSPKKPTGTIYHPPSLFPWCELPPYELPPYPLPLCGRLPCSLCLSSALLPRNAPTSDPMTPCPALWPRKPPPSPPATAPMKPRSPSCGLLGSAGSRA